MFPLRLEPRHLSDYWDLAARVTDTSADSVEA
jgi:hypothetical protein